MKRILKISILLIVAALLLNGCAGKFKQIKITSAALESVRPSGLKGFDAVVAVGIDNPATDFNIMNLEADIYRDSLAIIHVTAENVAVEGKLNKVYRVPMKGTINPSLSWLQLAMYARSFHPEEYTVNVHAKAKIGRIGKDLAYTGISLSDLMKKE